MNVRIHQGEFFRERMTACVRYLKRLKEGTITGRDLCSGEYGGTGQAGIQHSGSDTGVC